MAESFINQHGKAPISTALVPQSPTLPCKPSMFRLWVTDGDIWERTFLSCLCLTSLYFYLFLALRIKPDGMLPTSTRGEHVTQPDADGHWTWCEVLLEPDTDTWIFVFPKRGTHHVCHAISMALQSLHGCFDFPWCTNTKLEQTGQLCNSNQPSTKLRLTFRSLFLPSAQLLKSISSPSLACQPYANWIPVKWLPQNHYSKDMNSDRENSWNSPVQWPSCQDLKHWPFSLLQPSCSDLVKLPPGPPGFPF